MNGLTPAKNTKATLEMVLAMMLSGTIGYFVISSGQSFWNVVFFRCLIGAATLVTKRVEQVPSYLIALIQVCVGIVMLLPFVQFSQLPQSSMPWVDLIILGVVNTGFMYVIMYDAFQKLPTNLIAILSFIYPITALFVDYIAFSTQITLWQGIGVGLILLSVAAVKFNWNLARFRSVKRA